MDKLIDYILNSIEWTREKIIIIIILMLISIIYIFLWMYFIWEDQSDIALEFFKNTIIISFLAFLILGLLLIASFGKKKHDEEEYKEITERVTDTPFLKEINTYLTKNKYTKKDNYSNKNKEVWFLDNKRIIEFIYKKDGFNIAVLQTDEIKKIIDNIWENYQKWGTSYYIIRIPYDKLNDNVVESIKEMIKKTTN